jgi:hypothetical protein
MRPESQSLWDHFRTAVADRSDSSLTQDQLECSIVCGTTHLTIDEVGNSVPAEIEITVGTTRNQVALDDSAYLPAASARRYFASLSDEPRWHDLYGNVWTTDELTVLWLEIFDDYVFNAN